jgi:hypothetical protein
MLTLVKTDDAVPIVGIYSGKKAKKPDDVVYFTHETQKDNQNVATAAGVLHLHRSELKKEFRLNGADFKEVCRMIDDEEEPEQGDPLRQEFWSILDRFENFLQREMWIGDDKDVRFEMNFPLKKADWPGTMTCIGSSGSGKTYHVVSMIHRYFKAAPVHSRRQVVWLSPELKIDKTLSKLRDNDRYRLWFHGIDISEKNLKEKGRPFTKRRLFQKSTEWATTSFWCWTTSQTPRVRCIPFWSGFTTACCASRGTVTTA